MYRQTLRAQITALSDDGRRGSRTHDKAPFASTRTSCRRAFWIASRPMRAVPSFPVNNPSQRYSVVRTSTSDGVAAPWCSAADASTHYVDRCTPCPLNRSSYRWSALKSTFGCYVGASTLARGRTTTSSFIRSAFSDRIFAACSYRAS